MHDSQELSAYWNMAANWNEKWMFSLDFHLHCITMKYGWLLQFSLGLTFGCSDSKWKEPFLTIQTQWQEQFVKTVYYSYAYNSSLYWKVEFQSQIDSFQRFFGVEISIKFHVFSNHIQIYFWHFFAFVYVNIE